MKAKALNLFLLILITSAVTLAYYHNTPAREVDLMAKNVTAIPHSIKTDPDKTKLIGSWSMTDTPYLIKITAVHNSGKLEVAYFNPHKIEIEMANWKKSGTLLSVYIELQDSEFPGSAFTLNYIPERDILDGEYYDEMQGMIYPVQFVRVK